MKRDYITILISLLILIASGCSGGKTKGKKTEIEDFTRETGSDFVPEAGMSLQDVSSIPDMEWAVDTIKGVCLPDTLVLWAVYHGRYLPTNIRGTIDKAKYLTDSGRKAIASKDGLTLSKMDFDADARLKYDLDVSRSAFVYDADSIYYKRLAEMTGVARDFFSSYGMAKYMAEPLASVWQQKYNAAEADDSEVENPFNGSYYVEFDTENISVDVVDAPKGKVLVRTYCLDENTIGYQGWTQWEMQMCLEGRAFKVKTLPRLHRYN